jgi:uncharacterized protein
VFTPSEATYTSARSIVPDELPTLDALHLACALELGDDLDAVVTYNDLLRAGCTAVGVSVVSPR